jgi:transcriptional regulator with XRE-family HTH domain
MALSGTLGPTVPVEGTVVETARRIREAQRAMGLTNEELARRTGVALRTVLRWRKGEAPRLPNLVRLADALDVPKSYLIQDVERDVALEQLAQEVVSLNEKTEVLAERVGDVERLLRELVGKQRADADRIERRSIDIPRELAASGVN